MVNGLGEFFFKIAADQRDRRDRHVRRPDRGRARALPDSRRAAPDGRCAYSFTMFQAPGMPDDLFESQYQSLLREFENLRREFA